MYSERNLYILMILIHCGPIETFSLRLSNNFRNYIFVIFYLFYNFLKNKTILLNHKHSELKIIYYYYKYIFVQFNVLYNLYDLCNRRIKLVLEIGI